jgi:FMN-dependent NADH-azoreductase
MKLLHLDTSALGPHSVSREVGAAIVENLRGQQADVEISYRDLATTPLPHWLPHADAGSEAALLDQAVLQEFLDADVVVIGAPMYNFSIPSQLKAWLDRVLVAGKTFRYGASGPEGLAGGKRVIIASSRGGIYSQGPAAAMDFQEPYLRTAFAFIGIESVEFIRAEGVALGDEARQSSLKSAHAAVASLPRKAA